VVLAMRWMREEQPAPKRSKKTIWKDFIAAHMPVLAVSISSLRKSSLGEAHHIVPCCFSPSGDFAASALTALPAISANANAKVDGANCP
jgi:hypothetical protein